MKSGEVTNTHISTNKHTHSYKHKCTTACVSSGSCSQWKLL